MGCSASVNRGYASGTKAKAINGSRPVGRVNPMPQLSQSNGLMKITSDMLERFLSLDRSIQTYEDRGIEVLRMETAKDQEAAEKAVEDAKLRLKAARDNQSGVNSDTIEERIESVSKESLEANLSAAKATLAAINSKLNELNADFSALQTMYDQQFALLGEAFGGEYGSAEENRLEAELDTWMSKRDRIRAAQRKWANAQCLVHYTCTQLSFCYDRLQAAADSDETSWSGSGALLSDTLKAALQNLATAQQCISGIAFPYMKDELVGQLRLSASALAAGRPDCDARAAHLGALASAGRQSFSLLEWINGVLVNVIRLDLADAHRQVVLTRHQLRLERIKLIRALVEPQATPEQIGRLDEIIAEETAHEPDTELNQDQSNNCEQLFVAKTDDDKYREGLIGEIWDTYDKDQNGLLDRQEVASFVEAFVSKSGGSLAALMPGEERRQLAEMLLQHMHRSEQQGLSKDDMLSLIQQLVVHINKRSLSAGSADDSGGVRIRSALVPSKEDLFGSITAIRVQQAESETAVARQQGVSKTRQQLELQEKLQRRRDRRSQPPDGSA